jgi:hypothetical protein
MPGTTLITSLQLAEVSAVDHPATELEGWLLMKSAKGLAKAQREFAALLKEIREADESPAWKAAAITKAVEALPRSVTEPVIEQAALTSSIRKEFDIPSGDDLASEQARVDEAERTAQHGGSLITATSKERHSTRHPETGHFVPKADEPKGGLFTHLGNVLPALRGTT